MSETPRRLASRPLSDFIPPLTDEQAAQVIAVFNRRLYAADTHNADTHKPAA